MNSKALVILAWTAMIAASADAFNYEYSYRFDGTLTDNFRLMEPSVTDLSLDQANLQLEMHSFDLVPAGTRTALAHSVVLPQFNESWVATADLTIPEVYENTVPQTGEQIQLGLGVGFGPNPFITGDMASLMLGVQASPSGSTRLIDAHINAISGSLDGADVITNDETVTVTFEYDAATQTLQARHSAQSVLASIVGTTVNWGMDATDNFGLYLFGKTDGQALFTSVPLKMDNFQLKINQVPEPAGIALVVGAVCLVGWRLRRRN